MRARDVAHQAPRGAAHSVARAQRAANTPDVRWWWSWLRGHASGGLQAWRRPWAEVPVILVLASFGRWRLQACEEGVCIDGGQPLFERHRWRRCRERLVVERRSACQRVRRRWQRVPFCRGRNRLRKLHIAGAACRRAGWPWVAGLADSHSSQAVASFSPPSPLSCIAPIFARVSEVIAPTCEVIAPIFAPVFEVIAPIFASTLEVVAPLFAPISARMLEVIAPALEVVAPIFAPIFEVIAPTSEVIAPMCAVLAPTFEVVAPILGVIVPASEVIVPTLEVIARTFEVIAPISEVQNTSTAKWVSSSHPSFPIPRT